MPKQLIQKLTNMELKAIGEVLNLSLGSSAASVSELLEQRVSITSPVVKLFKTGEFSYTSFEPAIGIEINYINGLTGKNYLVLKESDVKPLIKLLLMTNFSEEKIEPDELNTEAICRIMNQMMSAAAAALSQFLNRSISISPPISFPIENSSAFKSKHFDANGDVISVNFRIVVGDVINSTFLNVMSVEFAKELIAEFDLSNAQAKPQYPEADLKLPGKRKEAEMGKNLKMTERSDFAEGKEQESKQLSESYNVSKAIYPKLDFDEGVPAGNGAGNLNMIMSIPLEVTVEIGRTSKKIKDILELSPGSVVELDKQAGSQVDIFVNGKSIAKGDVVVVNDFYGVRITEITSSDGILKVL